MIQTFTKKDSIKGFRGFTLIELLVVIAIIGLLSTIIAAPIQNARKKARDAKKIAEIKAVQLALDQYAEANAGQYPYGLGYLEPVYMPLLPSFASTTLTTVASQNKFAFTPYVVTGATVGQIVFGYHLGVHLETYSQGLDNDRDCLGAENLATLASYNGTSTCGFYPASAATIQAIYYSSTTPQANNYGVGMMPGRVLPTGTPYSGMSGTANYNVDFDGSDNDITRCNATVDCVFDVTGQQ